MTAEILLTVLSLLTLLAVMAFAFSTTRPSREAASQNRHQTGEQQNTDL